MKNKSKSDRHLKYIKHHRKGFYTSLVIGCELNRYLADINKQAEEMFDTLISQFKTVEGITEQLKADNQMAWVGRMNNIGNRATEIVNMDFIYTWKEWTTIQCSPLFKY